MMEKQIYANITTKKMRLKNNELLKANLIYQWIIISNYKVNQ